MQWHPIVVLICISLMTNIWRRQWQPTPVLLAWKIPWTEETGGLQSMGSLGIRHDWVTSLSLFPFMHWRRKWQPTPVFLPRDGGAWWAAVCGVAQSWTRLKQLSSSSSSSSNDQYWKVCLGNEARSFCRFWDCIQVLHFGLFCDRDGYSISPKGFLPAVVDIMVIWVKFTHSSPSEFADS